jgi:hypothetical protein
MNNHLSKHVNKHRSSALHAKTASVYNDAITKADVEFRKEHRRRAKIMPSGQETPSTQ